MKLTVDTPVLDLQTGKASPFPPYGDATFRRLIIFIGSNPCPAAPGQQGDTPEEAAEAYKLAAKAAVAPENGSIDLSIDEAVFLKTRAYRMLFPGMAGQLDQALQNAHDGAKVHNADNPHSFHPAEFEAERSHRA